jgi:hypothetical protein
MQILNPPLQPGYAERSTKRHPKEPTLVVVRESEISQAQYQGTAYINGDARWDCWRIPKSSKSPAYYLFQYNVTRLPNVKG